MSQGTVLQIKFKFVSVLLTHNYILPIKKTSFNGRCLWDKTVIRTETIFRSKIVECNLKIVLK